MIIDIDKLTERELTDLNRKIVRRLKFLESMRTHTDLTEQGQKWNVTPNQLTRVKNSKPEVVKPDNVIELYPDR